jgi:hypothetical protein
MLFSVLRSQQCHCHGHGHGRLDHLDNFRILFTNKCHDSGFLHYKGGSSGIFFVLVKPDATGSGTRLSPMWLRSHG